MPRFIIKKKKMLSSVTVWLMDVFVVVVDNNYGRRVRQIRLHYTQTILVFRISSWLNLVFDLLTMTKIQNTRNLVF